MYNPLATTKTQEVILATTIASGINPTIARCRNEVSKTYQKKDPPVEIIGALGNETNFHISQNDLVFKPAPKTLSSHTGGYKGAFSSFTGLPKQIEGLDILQYYTFLGIALNEYHSMDPNAPPAGLTVASHGTFNYLNTSNETIHVGDLLELDVHTDETRREPVYQPFGEQAHRQVQELANKAFWKPVRETSLAGNLEKTMKRDLKKGIESKYLDITKYMELQKSDDMYKLCMVPIIATMVATLMESSEEESESEKFGNVKTQIDAGLLERIMEMILNPREIVIEDEDDDKELKHNINHLMKNCMTLFSQGCSKLFTKTMSNVRGRANSTMRPNEVGMVNI